MKRSCIVGYGVISPNHLKGIKGSGRATLYAVCDNDEEKLKKAKAENPDVVIYKDFEDALRDGNIDVIHICTPHYLHGPMAEAAMRAGKDVFLEKPVCLNAEEFARLRNAQAETGKKVCVCFQARARECMKKAPDYIKELGEVKAVYGNVRWFRDSEYYKSGEWRGKWATEGGGLIINQAIHTLDEMGLLGGGFAAVNATLTTKKLMDVIEVEDTAEILFKMKNGATAVLTATNCYPINAPTIVEVNCEKGTLRYTNDKLYVIKGKDEEVVFVDEVKAIGKTYWGSGHDLLIDTFYKYLETGEGDIVTLGMVKNTMDAVFAVYESAKSGKEVII